MVARKLLVRHENSTFDIDYDTDDGLEVFKFQLFSLTSIPPDEQKIVCDDDHNDIRIISDDSDLNSVEEKVRLISIGEDVAAESSATVDSHVNEELLKSDEEFARLLQHIALECTTKSLCWNCQEPGHTANSSPNEGICHRCGKGGHQARDCHVPPPPPGDVRLCNNCYKQGHLAPDCTNEKACNNCRRTGHLARDCTNEPVCNLCNLSGHVTRGCPKADDLAGRGIVVRGGGGGGYRDVVCRNCQQLGHMSRDCVTPVICNMCGGRGHLAYECPSGRYLDRYPRRY